MAGVAIPGFKITTDETALCRFRIMPRRDRHQGIGQIVLGDFRLLLAKIHPQIVDSPAIFDLTGAVQHKRFGRHRRAESFG